MVSSKSLRRLVAGTVAALFLACQGAGVVYARAADTQESEAAQESCHEPSEQDSKSAGNSACPGGCQSQHNSSAQSFANIYTVTDLPAITVRVDNIVAVRDSALPAEPPLLRIQSPPLLVLHSRLRI